jgi:hypothetical protein
MSEALFPDLFICTNYAADKRIREEVIRLV